MRLREGTPRWRTTGPTGLLARAVRHVRGRRLPARRAVRAVILKVFVRLLSSIRVSEGSVGVDVV